MKRGFTLVGLSILLIIIGLLTGGILIARSMIQTAKMHSFINQLQQFDISISNFQTKYNSLPGDSPVFPVGGNGDGIVGDSLFPPADFANDYVKRFDSEVSNAWTHLSQAGFMPDHVIYSNDASAGIKSGVNVPGAKIGKTSDGKGAGVIIYRDQAHLAKYFIADFSALTGPVFNYSPNMYKFAFTPIEVQILDIKTDDGLRGSGTVSGYTYVANTCYNGTAYLNNNNIECTMLLRMNLTNGAY